MGVSVGARGWPAPTRGRRSRIVTAVTGVTAVRLPAHILVRCQNLIQGVTRWSLVGLGGSSILVDQSTEDSSGRVRGHAEQVGSPGVDFHHEQTFSCARRSTRARISSVIGGRPDRWE
jgi:hypothetical protein